VIDFSSSDNNAHWTVNGIEVSERHITYYCPGAEYVVTVLAKPCWRGISVSPETLASASQALLGYEITVPKATTSSARPLR
jgi:hypothetical protein